MKYSNNILFSLALALLGMALPTSALADSIPVAVFSNDGKTMTFTYADEAAVDDSVTYQLGRWTKEDTTVTKVVFDKSFAKARPTSTRMWFAGFDKLKEIIGLENLNTSEVTDMTEMFGDCLLIDSINVSGFDTGNVKSMLHMFNGCRALRDLDLHNFKTDNVTDMGGMFYECRLLKKLDLSSFNTAKVTNMAQMFCWCFSLEELDISEFDTHRALSMYQMFWNCRSLPAIDVSSFSTSSVDDMSQMFDGCSSLTDIDMSGFNTSRAIDISYMFRNCTSLTKLDISTLKTSRHTDMRGLLKGCNSITELNVGSNSFSTVAQSGAAFQGVGTLYNPCKLIVNGDFDKSVLGTVRHDYNKSSYTWLEGHFAEPVTTDIKSITRNNNDIDLQTAPAYNLGGQKVDDNHKGLTIGHKRKFIRR